MFLMLFINWDFHGHCVSFLKHIHSNVTPPKFNIPHSRIITHPICFHIIGSPLHIKGPSRCTLVTGALDGKPRIDTWPWSIIVSITALWRKHLSRLMLRLLLPWATPTWLKSITLSFLAFGRKCPFFRYTVSPPLFSVVLNYHVAYLRDSLWWQKGTVLQNALQDQIEKGLVYQGVAAYRVKV